MQFFYVMHAGIKRENAITGTATALRIAMKAVWGNTDSDLLMR